MREIDRRTTVGRRLFMRGAATAVPAAALASVGMGISAQAAWAQQAKTLQPHSMATLVRMSRDIYPHDRLPDSYYVNAVAPYDDKAKSDADLKKLLDDGVGRLNSDAKDRFKQVYLEVPDESDRIVLLVGIAQTPFFSKIRSGLVVSFYNQPNIWKRFGYEGSSFEYGGYLHRGFNDIDWPPAV